MNTDFPTAEAQNIQTKLEQKQTEETKMFFTAEARSFLTAKHTNDLRKPEMTAEGQTFLTRIARMDANDLFRIEFV
jgi:hypothetical protein